MTYDNDPNRAEARNPGPQQPGWGIPLAVGAVIIAAAAIIFASAGPDRTRTADVRKSAAGGDHDARPGTGRKGPNRSAHAGAAEPAGNTVTVWMLDTFEEVEILNGASPPSPEGGLLRGQLGSTFAPHDAAPLLAADLFFSFLDFVQPQAQTLKALLPLKIAVTLWSAP